jgi:3D (Asp-Asp-Asp) domain-containing protein
MSSARGIFTEVRLLGGVGQADVTLLYHEGSINGEANMPVTSNGNGFVAEIAASAGSLQGLDAQANVVSATKTYQDGGPNPAQDSGGVQVDLPPLFSASGGNNGVRAALQPNDVTPTTINTRASGRLLDASVTADFGSGLQAIATAQEVDTRTMNGTTAAGADHDIKNSASSEINDVNVDLTVFGLGPAVVTVDSIFALTQTSCDGTLSGARAVAKVTFLNLRINKIDYTTAPPGTQVPISSGLASALVTIIPIQTTSTSATANSADVTAVLIEIMTDALGLPNGTTIALSTAHADCHVGTGQNVGPGGS